MKLASVLTPLSDYNLTLAAQTGVEEIVCRYPGPDLSLLDEAKARIESFGMRLGVIEGYLPIDNLKLGRDDGTEMEQMKALLRHLGELGVPHGLLQLHGRHRLDPHQRRRTRARRRQGHRVRHRRARLGTDPRPRAVPRRARTGRQA